eukprot:Opistho-1_new@5950
MSASSTPSSTPTRAARRTHVSEDAVLSQLATDAEQRLAAKRKARKEARQAIENRQESIARKEEEKMTAQYDEISEIDKLVRQERIQSALEQKPLEGAGALNQPIEKLVLLKDQLDKALQSKDLVESSKAALRFSIEHLRDTVEDRDEQIAELRGMLKQARLHLTQEQQRLAMISQELDDVRREKEQLAALSAGESAKPQEVQEAPRLSVEGVEMTPETFEQSLKQVKELRHALARAEQELSESQKEKAELADNAARMRSENVRLQERIKIIETESPRTLVRRPSVDADSRELERKYEEEALARGRVERQLAKANQRAELLEKDIAEGEETIRNLRSEARKTQREMKQQTQQIADLKAEIEMLKAKVLSSAKR